ncbi:MAG TPA: ABC transporter substrate-binding protein [Mycobacteriales bacterium]|nr:ABC transporter substrate-binding protein [Mycobacteriales bacterium]
MPTVAPDRSVSRRHFCYLAATAAGSAVLAACSSRSSDSSSAPQNGGPPSSSAAPNTSRPHIGGSAGSATRSLPKPATFQDAPSLRGKGLPPVEERLPENPYVIPHNWVGRGRYGGVLNTTVLGSTGLMNAGAIYEHFYGFSPVRWLNDGLDIGPGTAEKWSSNADATVWTVQFRKGLKWSDGHPMTVDDVLFWYNDMVRPGHDALTVPPDCLSADGTPCEMSRVDDVTLKLTFNAPQPLVPDYLAAQVKGNIAQHAPTWIMPKHYLKQFHPKYNPDVPKDWDAVGGTWEIKADWIRNPECPTLTGYRCASFDNNKGVVLERNPYYYAVTKEGDQLPYIDTWRITLVQDLNVVKLQLQQGKMDYCHGTSTGLDLSDVSTLSKTKKSGNYNILLWNNGTGTGSIFYFNYDYIAKDPKYGKLIRDKRFIRAISHAMDRDTARKSIYFQQGETTTGTMSPNAIEFHTQAEGPKIYAQWRDSYKKHDLAKAKSLLAEMGLKDVNGDGYVEFPDGSKLTIEIPYAADISGIFEAADDLLVANAKAAGIRMVRRPIAPEAWSDQWTSGTLMSHTNDGITDGPNFLVYPQWMIPLEPSRWAPLEGSWNSLTGSPKQQEELGVAPIKRHPPRMAPEKGGPIAKLVDLYNQTKLEPDPMKRHQLCWQMVRVHIEDGPFFLGAVANYPEVSTHNLDLKNVPEAKNLALGGNDGTWVVPSPAAYDPECWFWSDPDQHT